MKGKDYVQKRAADFASLAYQVALANQANNINSPTAIGAFFIGHISPDRSTCADPSGTSYNLSFTGNPKEFDVCQNVGGGNAICVAADISLLQIGTTKKRLWALFRQAFSYHTFDPTSAPTFYDPVTQTGSTAPLSTFDVFYLQSLKTQKIVEVFNTNSKSVIAPLAFPFPPFLAESAAQAPNPSYTFGAEFDNTGSNLIIWMLSSNYQTMGGEIRIPNATLDGQSATNINISYRVFTNIGIGEDKDGNATFNYSALYSQDLIPVYTCSSTDAAFVAPAFTPPPSQPTYIFQVGSIGVPQWNGATTPTVAWTVATSQIKILLGVTTTVNFRVINSVNGNPFTQGSGLGVPVDGTGTVNPNVHEIELLVTLPKSAADSPINVVSTQTVDQNTLSLLAPGNLVYPKYNAGTGFFPSYAFSSLFPFTSLNGSYLVTDDIGNVTGLIYYIYSLGFNFSNRLEVSELDLLETPLGNYPISFRLNSKGEAAYVMYDDIVPTPASWVAFHAPQGIRWLTTGTSMIIDPVLTANIYNQNTSTDPISYNKRVGPSYSYTEALLPPPPASPLPDPQPPTALPALILIDLFIS